MNKIVKSSALLLAVILTAGAIQAQDNTKTMPADNKRERIIIRKKGDSKEKLTIVVDGDKVTVNGKPVDDYKSDDIDIIRDDAFDMPMPPIPPMAMAGGADWKMFGDDFMRELHSNKAFLGVMTKKTEDGAKITEVTKESAAEKAGLKEGDVITKVGDDKIEDADDLYKAVGKYKPEDKVTVTYKRDGKENKATVTLAENKQVRAFAWKNGDGDDNFNFKMNPRSAPLIQGWNGDGDFDMWNDDKPRLGVQVQDTEDDKGVKLLDVDEDEPADKAGLKEDDIITQFNGKNISSVDSFKDMMKDVKKGDTVKLTYLRDGKSQTADIKFPKDLKTTDL